MKYLAINKKPYTIDYAIFDKERKVLLGFGTQYIKSKDYDLRIEEIWKKLNDLLETEKPNIVITQMVNLNLTLKRDLEYIFQIKTILRKLCYDKNIMYNEFKTSGWEKKITKLKKPSPKSKLDIAHQYSNDIDRVEVANALILGEGVVWGRLQIGRD